MPPLRQANILRCYSHRQYGAALMVMLVILVLGATAILVRSFSTSTLKNSRQVTTAAALAQAKSALISYAITYGDTHPDAHPNHIHGYLPCVDIDGKDLSSNPAEGASDLDCGSKNISMIGRFPWKSLGLPALRDSYGECLWYAVSGTYKNNPKTNLMNWDTYGLFEVLNADGVTVAQNVVAVVFSPGAVLSAQNRAANGNAPLCGGNYTVANYLDNDTVHNINNAAIATGKFILPHEHRDANGNVILTSNDQIMFITQQDIWNAIKKRNDFGDFVSSLLNAAKTCPSEPVIINFDTAPPTQTVVTVGNPRIGRIPKSCLPSSLDQNWQDNLLFAKCSTSANCLTVNGSNCNGVVIFSGERNTSQARNTNAQKNTWSNYLEDTPSANLTAFTIGGTSFSGAMSYSTASPSTDLVVCTSPQPSPAPTP